MQQILTRGLSIKRFSYLNKFNYHYGKLPNNSRRKEDKTVNPLPPSNSFSYREAMKRNPKKFPYRQRHDTVLT